MTHVFTTHMGLHRSRVCRFFWCLQDLRPLIPAFVFRRDVPHVTTHHGTTAYKNELHLSERLDKKVVKLHFLALGAELTLLIQQQGWLQETAIETATLRSLDTPAILAISLDLAGSESFVRRCPVVKQHDMFQENFEHVPRVLFARSCVLVGVFFSELL